MQAMQAGGQNRHRLARADGDDGGEDGQCGQHLSESRGGLICGGTSEDGEDAERGQTGMGSQGPGDQAEAAGERQHADAG
jgi:hypothetical protein